MTWTSLRLRHHLLRPFPYASSLALFFAPCTFSRLPLIILDRLVLQKMVSVTAGKKASDTVWLKKGLTSVADSEVEAFRDAGFSAKTIDGPGGSARSLEVIVEVQ